MYGRPVASRKLKNGGKQMKKESGITLIALVITIIVHCDKLKKYVISIASFFQVYKLNTKSNNWEVLLKKFWIKKS